MFSLKEIRELIDLVADRGLGGLEIERSGFRLRIDGVRPAAAEIPVVATLPAASQPVAGAAPRPVAAPAEEPEAAADENVHVITSPIVGTFYRSPSPESDPFAQVGERISKGKILCIIESMKLMNEIESDVEGEVLAVYPRNGQPVEYGEKLFAIRLAA
ncbi:MAG TPA: acetyl-CoA carboxylase biotin carboxyl carrier protein [Thermoanaerobaculia bacterium]|jgi:acetyl-CoA carboxylase biotin carboxyl carrier protein|nr:acetyl-CoA carboxylase biotin carboxyl carrier protein [Thermoanaerobaculia bacterium]